MRKEHRANIGKESQRQPAKDFGNQPLRPPYLKGHDQQGNGDDEDDQRDGDKQIDSGSNVFELPPIITRPIKGMETSRLIAAAIAPISAPALIVLASSSPIGRVEHPGE